MKNNYVCIALNQVLDRSPAVSTGGLFLFTNFESKTKDSGETI